LTVTWYFASAVATETTIISIRVSVPVLSEQMRDTEPSVSTAGRRRMMALRWAIRCTPIASVIVMIAGRPSGISSGWIGTVRCEWRVLRPGAGVTAQG
jgi:hypothetical protein